MNTLRFAGSIFISLLMACVCHAEEKASAVNYAVSVLKMPRIKARYNEIVIEQVIINKSKNISDAQARKITKALKKFSQKFYEDAKDCYDPSMSGPWGFKAKLDQINYIDNTVSVVFATDAVCSGSPELNKEAKVFSTLSGDEITIKELVQKFVPTLLESGATIRDGRLKLGADAAEKLMDENKFQLDSNTKEFCESYLKRISYSVWFKDNNLKLQPLFSHPDSVCQKEYAIQFK
ncbi:hypothetical protein [Paraherbaspirillum soli]|uniref:Uncharacterized protein n=1 Tax=Paraherbaspirillum soli TaxID=631222 RepID=A0ABW0M7G2_9BURK